MILTGGFDGFDVLTAGFDGFDVLTAGFDVFDDFDSWFVVLMFLTAGLMFLMIWQEVFVFEGLYTKWQKVLMFLMILTGGFWCFWQKVFDDFDRRFLFWRLV